jgi:hypothetical protein
MDSNDRETQIGRLARRHGLRLTKCIAPVGYILVNRRNVVEFGASSGSHRATLDEVEKYLMLRRHVP